MNVPKQTVLEERLNSWSHLLFAFVGIIASYFLIVKSLDSSCENGLLSSLIYTNSFVFLFLASGFYHLVKKEKLKTFLRIVDHCSIFILIAGTYTPLALSYIAGTEGWVLFIIQWSIALVGIGLKIFFTGRFEIISVIFYLIMGWMIAYKVPLLFNELPQQGFVDLVLGGIFYTLGIVFYLLDAKVKFFHFIWHLFVVCGALSHFVFIYYYIF